MLQPLQFTAAFDTCVAVDSAYHFPLKQHLLRDVCGCLKEGGAFACSDMLLHQVGLKCVHACSGWRSFDS